MPRYAPKTLWQSFVNRIAAADAEVQKLVTTFIAAEAPTRRDRMSRAAEVALILRELDKDIPGEAQHIVTIAYDRASRAGRKQAAKAPDVVSSYSRLQRETISLLADNLTGDLKAATNKLGRQSNDAFRKHGIRSSLTQVAREAPRGLYANTMAERLRKDGITAFVDKAGRRWTLENYSRMAVRTTTSEAQNRAIENVAISRGLDLVQVDAHPTTSCDRCLIFDGKVYSITGRTPGFPLLQERPPFHPNCEHFLFIPEMAFLHRDLERAA